MEPLEPPVLDPVSTYTDPEMPSAEENSLSPDLIEIVPLLPSTVCPVLIDMAPLDPAEPASALFILKAPLDEMAPYPEAMDTDPPVCNVLCPELITIRPPEMMSPSPTTRLTLPLLPPVAPPVFITTAPE